MSPRERRTASAHHAAYAYGRRIERTGRYILATYFALACAVAVALAFLNFGA